MKKDRQHPDEDLRPEYDFSKLEGGVRGKYAKRFKQGANLVLLDPDVARAFPDDSAVNQALRVLMKAAQAVKTSGG